MIKLKNKTEIEKLKIGGKKLATILNETAKMVKPGISAHELNIFVEKMIKDLGAKSSFKNYRPSGAKTPFPASLCVSINDEIVHGIPSFDKQIKNGDVVKIDCGIISDGLFTDSAITIAVGDVPKEIKEMINRTKEALNAGIKQCKIGNHIGDIGLAIENVANDSGFTIVNDLTGHGVGYAVHEDPYVPNTADFGKREKMENGLVIAIEPMFTNGGPEIIVAKDGHTYKTKDGSIATQFEHTIAITEDGPIILTKL
ncbi:MAG TPA: type I methionyl aminopeptidase [Candidatus Paceibacterota bacterium]|nr:type I methionyl aminopeptidase [Candidatus Paceibacterota bacterium]HMP19130.1 type I methionyl aminopeptidase [Candidatus Paceibacterota bacterium]HMP85161.1 type I methionyl aminopeptidase [Candidatus Paceibacterota bacterium]